jgi:nucleoid-associated protein YgaU
MIGDDPVDLEATYMLVTNDFLAAGGDGYEMFGGEILAYSGLLSEVLETYLRANPEISPQVEGRIVALPLVEVPEPEPAPEPEPTPVPEPTPAPADIAYTVKSGDWLSKIGMAYGVDWRVLADHNNLANPNLIFPGQIIMIPQ